MSEFPSFPKDFTWGVSTAAYQIEGAVDEDGRGKSVWDTFCEEPGRIVDGTSGRVATDHYHRVSEDVALMKELGVGAYRFSIAWPRIMPDASNAVNQKGLDFYSRLVDELLEAGIEPAATLFHWDTPQYLQDAGGWTGRDIAYRFGEYAAVMGEALGDRVTMWMPVNEPVMVTMFGHALGNHAPGLALGFGALPVAHHLLLGHGLAVQALRAAGVGGPGGTGSGGTGNKGLIGTASNHAVAQPKTDSPEDAFATDLYDTLINWTFADPVLLGKYPAEEIAALMPGPVEEDLKIISEPLDFFGINTYEPTMISARMPGDDRASDIAEGAQMPSDLPFFPESVPGYPTTDFGWSIVPDSLRQIIHTFGERYGDKLPPLYVTESGCSVHDEPPVDGRVHDQRRIDYHDGYLRSLRQAMDEGADVRGYFAWSLMDNFEWAAGNKERFGLVYVDYETQDRTPKDSYRWFQKVIKG